MSDLAYAPPAVRDRAIAGTAPQPEGRSVPVATTQLSAIIANLRERLAMLEKRLEPVLHRGMARPPQQANGPATAPPSALAEAISLHTLALQDCLDHVQSLIERVEL